MIARLANANDSHYSERMDAPHHHPPAAPGRVPAEPGPGPAAGTGLPPHWHSRQLFGPHAEVTIDHRGAIYRLRITSLGKLILTK